MKRIILFIVLGLFIFTGCAKKETGSLSLNKTGSMELEYADQFAVDYYENGCAVITIADERYILVPQGTDVPEHPDDMKVLQQPLDDLYVAASSAVDLLYGIDSLDKIILTSTSRENWSLPYMKDALDAEDIYYAGKYSAPDYEAILECDCDIAVESTMIYHNPQVKEKLESLGVPVLTERSSYEKHPLGRMEWIKLYGLLLGKEDDAEKFFEEKNRVFESVINTEIPDENKKTVAFFSINTNGYVTIHKPGDYVSRMIEFAGGKYAFTADELKVDENALSTMNIQMEEFYKIARDCDILIYNSTIEGNLDSVEQLTEKSSLLGDFKAVQSGNVWCTEKSMFQQTTATADIIGDLNTIIENKSGKTAFLYKLQ